MEIYQMKKGLGIYIHIPFCERKCNYCSFLSLEFEKNLVERYLNELSLEIKKQGNAYKDIYKVDTVFIGGGTPSLLNEKQIDKLMVQLRESYDIKEEAEITIETNPNSLNKVKLEAYQKNGINRLSMGVQSFDDELLSVMGRIHNEKDVFDKFHLARQMGFENINLDLMFGIPGQSEKQWKKTVEKAVRLNPEHISLYSLQIEENTPFYTAYKNETLNFLKEERINDMYIKASDRLLEAGYEGYEISNCAKKGFESQHNIKYWTMGEYLGLGSGASSYIDGTRRENSRELSQWREKNLNGDIHDEMGIYVFTGLRMAKGIDLNQFRTRFGKSFFDIYEDKLEFLMKEEKEGNLVLRENELFLTRKGMLKSNDLMCEFV